MTNKTKKNNDNIFNLVIDPLADSIKILFKEAKKALGFNIVDFDKLFKELGICNKSNEYPKLENVYEEDYFKRYSFKIPIGICVEDFKRHKEAIYHFLEVDNANIERNKSNIDIKVLTRVPKANYDIHEYKRKDFKIPLGYDLNNNKLILWDITSNNNCHCYIA